MRTIRIAALGCLVFWSAPPHPAAAGQQYDRSVLSRPLTGLLEEIVADPLLQGASVGVEVYNLDIEKNVFSHQQDRLINPASVTKMFTTAAALCLLHPSFRFKTEVYATRPIENGAVKGPLYLKGYGDPFLVNEQLSYLVSNLHTLAGVRRIDGPIVLDDSYFDNQVEGPGWEQDDTSRPYQAPMGALSFNFNSVAVLLFPGRTIGSPARVELYPDSKHFLLVNQTRTVPRGWYSDLDVSSVGRQTKIMVSGRVPKYYPGNRMHCRVMHPTWYTGYSFLEALKREGIRVQGGIRIGVVPSHAKRIYTHPSPALGELVRKVNKQSQNFMAEQLMKTLGAVFLGAPGSWWKGQQVLNAFLDEQVGIPAGTYILHNGSGLNDVNRVTASQVVLLLRYMWKRFDVQPDFSASLAVAGEDGTVENRFSDPSIARTMRVKTGSLGNVRALAGYVHTRAKHTLAFSMMISDYTCRSSEASRIIDRLASALSNAGLAGARQAQDNGKSGPEFETLQVYNAGE